MEKAAMTTQHDHTDESILDHLGDLKNHQEEALASYEEFEVDGSVYYYVTPGGFLHCKDSGAEKKMGSSISGYLTDETCHHRSPQRFVDCSKSTVLECRCGKRLLLLGREADWRKEGCPVFECCGCGKELSLRSE
jgi:hypothetical protein